MTTQLNTLNDICDALAEWLEDHDDERYTEVIIAFDLISDSLDRRAGSQVDNHKLTKLAKHGYGAVS